MSLLGIVVKGAIKHAPKILAGLACAGVIGVGVAAAKAAPKVEKKLDDAVDEKGEDLTTGETLVIMGKGYWLAIAVGFITVTSIIVGCVLSERRLNQMTALALASAAALQKYRQTVINEVDPAADNQIITTMQEKLPVPKDKEEIFVYEPYTKKWFWTTTNKLLIAQLNLEEKLQKKDYIGLNDVANELGLEPNVLLSDYVVTTDYMKEMNMSEYAFFGMTIHPVKGPNGEAAWQIVYDYPFCITGEDYYGYYNYFPIEELPEHCFS